MAVLEALSAGVPVVVCDGCGLAPVITRTGSGIVADGAVASVADAIGRLLADRVDYGRRARQTAQRKFATDAVARRLEGVYRRVRR